MIHQILKSIQQLLYKFDAFGDMVTITWRGRSSHNTLLGGFISIALYSSIIIYAVWRINLFNSRQRDEYYLSTYFREFSEIGAYQLKNGDVQFEIYINTPSFDNNDNPYGKILFHRYTNMNNGKDYVLKTGDDPSIRDEIISLKLCDQDQQNFGTWYDKPKKYCPDYSDDDILFGDFYSEKQSWLRLAIHFCDENERKKQGKECKSKNEIEEYFKSYQIGIDLIQRKPNLNNYDNPINKNLYSFEYQLKSKTGFTELKDIYYQQNTIELEDNAIGIIDEPIMHTLQQPVPGITAIKTYGTDWLNDAEGSRFKDAPMLYYYNILMSKEGQLHQRVRYNLLDVLGQTGGLLQSLQTILIACFFVYNYKQNETVIYNQYNNIDKKFSSHKRYFDNKPFVNLRFFGYDIYRAVFDAFCYKSQQRNNKNNLSQTGQILAEMTEVMNEHFNLTNILQISVHELAIIKQTKGVQSLLGQFINKNDATQEQKVKMLKQYTESTIGLLYNMRKEQIQQRNSKISVSQNDVTINQQLGDSQLQKSNEIKNSQSKNQKLSKRMSLNLDSEIFNQDQLKNENFSRNKQYKLSFDNLKEKETNKQRNVQSARQHKINKVTIQQQLNTENQENQTQEERNFDKKIKKIYLSQQKYQKSESFDDIIQEIEQQYQKQSPQYNNDNFMKNSNTRKIAQQQYEMLSKQNGDKLQNEIKQIF